MTCSLVDFPSFSFPFLKDTLFFRFQYSCSRKREKEGYRVRYYTMRYTGEEKKMERAAAAAAVLVVVVVVIVIVDNGSKAIQTCWCKCKQREREVETKK